MDILFYDIIQLSDAPDEIKSPSLADVSTETEFNINLDRTREFNCVGFGNTDATFFTINGERVNIPNTGDYPASYSNGLYDLTKQGTDTVTISHNGSYVGRIGLGVKRTVCASPSIQAGYWSTQNNRRTLSGQTVPGAGGVSGRKQGVTFTYKFDYDTLNDIQLAYPGQISKNYPFFIAFSDKEEYSRNFDKDMILGSYSASDLVLGDAPATDMVLGDAASFREEGRFLWGKLYATASGIENFIFQSSVNRLLASRAFMFEEAF